MSWRFINSPNILQHKKKLELKTHPSHGPCTELTCEGTSSWFTSGLESSSPEASPEELLDSILGFLLGVSSSDEYFIGLTGFGFVADFASTLLLGVSSSEEYLAGLFGFSLTADFTLDFTASVSSSEESSDPLIDLNLPPPVLPSFDLERDLELDDLDILLDLDLLLDLGLESWLEDLSSTD